MRSVYLYLDRDTPIHRLHPVTKIISLILLFSAAMIFNHPLYLLSLLAFTLLVGAIGKSLGNVKRVWVILTFLTLFCPAFWMLFLRRGDLLVRIGFIPIYRESLLYGIGMALRLEMMLICGVVFLSCTRIEEFTIGLKRLGLPFPLCFALSLAFRLVPTFMITASTVVEAQKSRGLDLESGNLISRIRRHLPLIIPIFIIGIRNTDLLAMALEARGFGFSRRRTCYLEFRKSWLDYAVVSFLLALNLACLAFRFSPFELPK
ncbi:TPA: energy-coupling factor transporter transmembrane protein EcfT [Candidatus Poribacteria bacterium]|nr:energy-coupling factor transporter transmembrane protein EcfT [Candidatus Poribacteria bacterium]